MAGLNLQMKRSSKPRSKVALDIGTHSIKMLEVSLDAGKLSLISFGMKKIEGSSRDAIVDSVRALSEELKVSIKESAISLAGPSLVARLISMPKMTDEELKNAVMFETEKFIPFDINDCVLDFYVQGLDAREKNNVNILLAAVKRDFVLQKIKIAEEAGFNVSVVDVDSFAAVNAFLKNLPSTETVKTIALLNIGASYTNLIILKGGLVSSVRDIAIGSESFNAAVLKKSGFAVDTPAALKKIPEEKTGEVMACAKAASNSLLDEIKLSFGYHENQSGGGIDEIYLSGGGAHFPSLEDAFGEALGLKPKKWDPFQFMAVDRARINADEMGMAKDYFAVAAGLALR